MDLGLLCRAQSRKVDYDRGDSTDGLANADVAMLEDDRRYFPPYECAVVVRQETLSRVAGLDRRWEVSGDCRIRRCMAQFRGRWRARPPAQCRYSPRCDLGKQR
jgi:hypothetical protein